MAEFASYLSYQRFSESVRTRWRYASDPEQSEFLKVLLATSVSRQEVIPHGCFLWRAQIGQDWYPCASGEDPEEAQPALLPSDRMKPLRDRARENRANPKGIPYLYLSTNQDTAMAEVRPWVGSCVSVAQFVLERDVRVVNCVATDKRLLLYSQEPEPQERERAVWRDVDRGCSQPVVSGDDTADYVPTQIVAEFFRANGLDGVAYGSSLGLGHNVALFDLETASVVGCGLFQILAVKFEWTEAANPYSAQVI
jgi:hypothetical protein